MLDVLARVKDAEKDVAGLRSTHRRLIVARPSIRPEVQAQVRLRQSPYPELWRITCLYRDGKLSLCGRISSFYLKQVAQTIAKDVPGVTEIENELTVVSVIAEPQR